jgi:Fe2+ transport system protein FeoA
VFQSLCLIGHGRPGTAPEVESWVTVSAAVSRHTCSREKVNTGATQKHISEHVHIPINTITAVMALCSGHDVNSDGVQSPQDTGVNARNNDNRTYCIARSVHCTPLQDRLLILGLVEGKRRHIVVDQRPGGDPVKGVGTRATRAEPGQTEHFVPSLFAVNHW